MGRFLCHIVYSLDSDSDASTLESMKEHLIKTGFHVTTSIEFETLKLFLEPPSNPPNVAAQFVDDDVSVFLLLIYSFGSGDPNKFFSCRHSPKNTVDLVDDILSKVIIFYFFVTF